MGKVIKGSAESAERYTVAIPSAGGAPPPPRAADELPEAAFELQAPSAIPEIDFAALNVQAQELIDEAERSAQLLVADAEARARAIVDDATHHAQALADDARRAGQAEGYAAGRGDAQSAAADMLAAMRELLDAIRSERHALLASAEPELVRLAVGIAERVLHQQIALDPGVVVEMARAAITRIVDREKLTVRVNPVDIERMREHRDELLALGDVKTMRVIEDQRVGRGGVVLETDAGTIDAKISTQLAEVRKILHIVDDVVVQPAATGAAALGPSEIDEAPFAAARAS